MNPRLLIALVLLGFGTGFFVSQRFYGITKTETVEKEVVKRDVVTVVKEVQRPDGTKETTTTSTDHSTEKRDATLISVLAPKPPDWHASLGAATSFKGLEPIYSLQLERRILGPFSLGV